MSTQPPAPVTIESEISSPLATVQLVRFEIPEPHAQAMDPQAAYRLDFSLTPRIPGAAINFGGRWAPHRYEPPGRLFAVPPGETLRARCNGGRQMSIICLLQAGAVQRWLDPTFEWTGRRLEASVDVPPEPVHQLMLRLGKELRHPGFASQALSEAVAIQIAIELGRYFRWVEDQPTQGGLPAWKIKLIRERIAEGESAPSLTELAGLCGLSVRHLTREFRTSYGCSIGEHITGARIERAKQQLNMGESIKAVAFAMGFASASSFCYAFRQQTGQTPRQYCRATHCFGRA